MSNKKVLGKAISGVVVFTLIAKIMGFFREILLSYYFGATGVSDAYLISQNIPGTIFQFVGTGLTTCFMPIYYKILHKEDNEATNRFTNKILTIVFTFSTVILIIVWLFTPQIVKVFAAGFKGRTLMYAVDFTRIGILSLYFSSTIYVYNSFLQANNIFGPTAFAAIPNSIFIMISIYLGAKFNVYLLSIGSCIAVGFQMLFLLPSMKKLHYRFSLNFNWKNIYIKEFFVLMLPVVLGVSVNQINALIDRTIASSVAVGGISALTYANSLISFIQGGLVDPVTTVFYPKITESVANNDHKRAKSMIEKAITIILSILIPITIGTCLYSRPIVKLLFGRGAFSDRAISMTSVALLGYSLGLGFIGIREFLARYYYANGNTSTPMINSTIGVVVNISFNLILSRFIGVGGLAVATSISAMITALLLWVQVKNKISKYGISLQIVEIVKIFISSLIMGLISYFIFTILPLNETIRLCLSIFVAIFIYFIMAIITKMEICNFVINLRRR